MNRIYVQQEKEAMSPMFLKSFVAKFLCFSDKKKA